MSNSNVPLFVQSGTYPARLDRSQTGSLLTGSANPDYPTFPRPGVRPHGVRDGHEQSLRVTVSQSIVSVEPGVAFVGGSPGTQGIEGIYVVLVNSRIQVSVPPYVPGANTEVVVGIRVNDPDSGDAAVGAGTWEIVALATNSIPAARFLKLATLVVPGDGTPIKQPIDVRTYTASLGGTIVVNGGLSIIQSQLAGASFGTQAYSTTDKLLYTRGVNGWEQNPSIAKVFPGVAFGEGTEGQLGWDKVNDTLYIYDTRPDGKLAWIKIASAPAAVRLGTATGQVWPEGPNDATVSLAETLKITIKESNWNSIDSANVALYGAEPGETKPPEKDLILQVRSTTSKAQIAISVTATVLVQKETVQTPGARMSLEPDDQNSLTIGAEVLRTTTKAVDEGTVVNESGSDGIYEMYSLDDPLNSMTWSGNQGQKAFTNTSVDMLQPGLFQVRLMFKAQKYGYFEISNLKMKITTR